MKITRTLLYIGGAANALFFVFHAWLGWNVWQWTEAGAGVRWLLETFNIACALCIGFFAYASLRYPTEMAETALGRGLSVLIVLLYGARAAGEFSSAPRVQPAVFVVSVAVALLYLVVLCLPSGRPAPVSSERFHARNAPATTSLPSSHCL
jgi:hypothetical protein